MNLQQLAKTTGFHPVTLCRWARTGKIPGENFRGNVGWKFDLDAVRVALARAFGNKAVRDSLRSGGRR